MHPVKVITLRGAATQLATHALPAAFGHSRHLRAFSTTPFVSTRISDAVTREHRELEDCFRRIVSSSNHEERTRYQNLFVWKLARHAVGEELVLYPAVEKNVAGGKAMAERERVETQKVKEDLFKFQKMSADDPEFVPVIKHLFADLSEHMQNEEKEDLTRLEQALQPEESESLAANFEMTKHFAPTESHPSTPNRYTVFETAVGLMTAPIDKLKDMFKRFPKD